MICKINGNTLTVTSAVKAEDLEKLKKSNPDALCLYEEKDSKKIPSFVIAQNTNGSPNFSDFGVVFNGKTYDGGYATMTVGLPVFETADEAKNYVAEKYGAGLKKLRELEQAIPGALATMAADRAAVLELIQF